MTRQNRPLGRVAVLASLLLAVLSACGAPNTADPTPNETTAQGDNTSESSQIALDITQRKLSLPDGYLKAIRKNTYIAGDPIEDADLLEQFTLAINESEVKGVMVNLETVADKPALADQIELDHIMQYPLALETSCPEDDLRIDLLAEQDGDPLVQMYFTVSRDNIQGNVPDAQDGSENYHVSCFVKSQALYETVQQAWGTQLTLKDLQNANKITLSYHDKSPFKAEHPQKIELNATESAEFTALLQNAKAIYDDHSFDIVVLIETEDKGEIPLFYAEDGCATFQLDGVSYIVEDRAAAESIMKYISRLGTI